MRSINKIQELGVVIVLFNPRVEDDITTKILALTNLVENVVVVDNSNVYFHEFPNLNGLKIIRNNENLGHATAQNIGCEYLYTIGIPFGIILDQDSRIKYEDLIELLNLMKKYNPGMIGPQIFVNNLNEKQVPNYLIKKRFGFKKIPVIDEVLEVYINITSGSLINLNIWNEIGRFWDDLFIEGVDDEFALRMRRNGYKVLVSKNVRLDQQYGNMKHVKKFGISFRPTNHSPIRLTYLYRNKMLIAWKYFFKEWQYNLFQVLSLVKRFITIMICEENKWIKFKSIIKGILLGFMNKKGKLKEVQK